MRILVVEPMGDFKGHTGEYAVHLCQALTEVGHNVILSTNRIYVSKYISDPKFQVLEVGNGKYAFEPYHKYRKSMPFYFYYHLLRCSFAVFATSLRLAGRGDFDVIYTVDVDRVIQSVLLRLFRRKIPPVVIEIHAANFSFREYPGNILRKAYKLLQKQLLEKSVAAGDIKGIHVLGEWHAERLREQLQVPPSFPIVAITEGREVPETRIDKGVARQKLGLGDYGGILLLCFGNLRKDKGIEDLLQAIALLSSANFKLMIVGNLVDYSAEELVTRIRQLGIEDKIVTRFAFVPYEEMYLYFYASDAAVFPYRGNYSGGNGPLRIACACGKPVIVSQVSEMGRITNLHHMGLVAEPDHPSSLAGAIAKFLEMPQAEKNKLAENAFQFARENTWHSMAVKLTEVFKQVVRS
ncbi:MAG: glycosyltransferase [Armatimonadota bacterium]